MKWVIEYDMGIPNISTMPWNGEGFSLRKQGLSPVSANAKLALSLGNHLYSLSLLWWDYLEGGSKLMADCLGFDENFELGKI
jgi:hypothetical protein